MSSMALLLWLLAVCVVMPIAVVAVFLRDE